VGKTSIEWTDHSWPVVNGCRRVSAGCENCYAERLTATRLSQTPKYEGLAVMKPGPTGFRRRDMADGSVRLTKAQGPASPRWTGEARLWVPHLDMPLKLKKPSRIFVCDMGDLFYEGVTNEQIAAVFGVMAACPTHTFQVLTKRPARARAWFRWLDGFAGRTTPRAACVSLAQRRSEHPKLRQLDDHRFWTWPLPNVWLGVSVEDQATADERIPILLDTPAALRFVSAEPLLGPVDLTPWLGYSESYDRFIGPCPHGRDPWDRCEEDCTPGQVQGIKWVIVGGESGPGARPFDLEWGRAIVRQCAEVGVSCFVKQMGARPFWVDPTSGFEVPLNLGDRKGGETSEWPEDLRVRQFPTAPPSNLPGKSEAPPPARGKNAADLGGGDTAGIKNGVGADRVTTPTIDAIRAALAPGKPLNRFELARATGRTRAAVSSCLTKMRARGAVVVEDGFWTLAAGGDDGTGLESEVSPGG
jgi:protein gp37